MSHPLFISITEYVKYPTECARHIFSKYYSVIIQINSDIVVHDIKTAVYDMFGKNGDLYDNICLKWSFHAKKWSIRAEHIAF